MFVFLFGDFLCCGYFVMYEIDFLNLIVKIGVFCYVVYVLEGLYILILIFKNYVF